MIKRGPDRRAANTDYFTNYITNVNTDLTIIEIKLLIQYSLYLKSQNVLNVIDDGLNEVSVELKEPA
jgi:hypothetical protein